MNVPRPLPWRISANPLRLLVVAAVMVRIGCPANLAISTYLKNGFTPTAIASDSEGNVYLAGSAVIDAASQTTGALVAKLDSKATQYLCLVYLDSAASDQVSEIAIDGSGNAYITGWTANPNFPVVEGSTLGTPPAGGNDTRSFVTKLNPQGTVVFSALVGGSAISTARGIALTPQGQILISGMAGSSGFPVTPEHTTWRTRPISAPVGPLYIPANLAGPLLNFSPPSEPMQMIVWVKP